MHWTLQTVGWVATPILELATAIAMFYRRLWREYPVFWSYLIAEVLRAALLFSIGNDNAHYFVYFYVYWITEIMVCLLGFFVVAEIFRWAFSSRLGLQRWGAVLFRVSLFSLIVFAVLTAAATHGHEPNKLVAGILLLKRVESLVRLCLVVALFVFVAALGLPWSSYTIGIATGFALYGIAEFWAMTARFHYGPWSGRMLTWTTMIAAFCQNIVWFAYFALDRKRSAFATPSARLNSSTAIAQLVEAREVLHRLWER